MNKSILILSVIFLLSFTLADITITPIYTPSGTIIGKYMNASYNISTDTLQNVTWNWNGTNFTLFDKNYWIWGANFDNRSDLGENQANWTTGNNSNALSFNGRSTYINMSNIGNNSATTISVWVKKGDWNQSGHYIMDGRNSAGAGWWFISDIVDTACTDSDGNICFYGKAEIKSGNFTANTWYNVVVVINTTSTYMYLNGNLMSVGASIPYIPFNTTNIGKRYTETGWFNGSMDEIRVFNRSLNDTEISQLYLHNTINRTGLINELLLDENSGLIATDTSGNSKNGTVIAYSINDISGSNNIAVPIGGLDWCSTCGKSYGGYNFTGENYSVGNPRYISMSNPITNATQNFTFSVWIKPYARTVVPTEAYHIINLWGAYDGWITWRTSNTLSINQRNETGDQSINSGTGLTPSGQWTFVTYTRQDIGAVHEFKVYLNGVYKASKNLTGTIITTALNTEIGSHTSYPQYEYLAFNGSIDDINLWNRTLSSSEITELYASQLTKYNQTNYELNINKTLPSATQTISYYICSANLTTSVCSTSQAITSGWFATAIANFSNKKYNVHPLFYGVGLQNPSRVVDGKIDTNCDGVQETNSNITWIRDTLIDGGTKINYYDGRIASYYGGFINNGFEYWYLGRTNQSISANSSYQNLTLGTQIGAATWGTYYGSYHDAIGTVNQTTDAHSGTYAVQMNASSAGYASTVMTFYTYVYLEANHTYTGSIWLKGSGDSVGWFGPTSAWANFSGYSTNANWHQVNVTITPNATQGGTWRFGIDINPGNNITADDLYFYKDGQPYKWWYVSGLDQQIAAADWEYSNGIKTMIILDYGTHWLANKNTKCVTSVSDTDVDDCAAMDNTVLAEVFLDEYKRVTQEDPLRQNNTYVQIWNEPYGGFFEDQLAGNSAKTDFVDLFNVTYNTFINYNPYIQVWGYRDTSYTTLSITAFTQMMFSNLSDKFSNYDFHPYSSAPYMTDTKVSDRMSYLISQANSYGATINHISGSEWQPTSQAMKNVSNANSDEYKTNIGYVYWDVLNTYGNMSTLIPYHFKDEVSYFNCFSRYPENTGNAPWMSISEKGLDNATDNVYYPPYTIVKSYADLCPAGSELYTSSSDDSNVLITTCKNGIIIQNIDPTNPINTTVTSISAPTKSFLMNPSTGTLYLSNESINMGTINNYSFAYLEVPLFTVNETSNTTKTAPTGEVYTSNELYISSSNRVLNQYDELFNYHLANTLPATLNATVVIQKVCPNSVRYVSDSGIASTPPFYCSGGYVYVNVTNYEPATNSNILTFDYAIQGGVGAGSGNTVIGGIQNATNATINGTVASNNQNNQTEKTGIVGDIKDIKDASFKFWDSLTLVEKLVIIMLTFIVVVFAFYLITRKSR